MERIIYRQVNGLDLHMDCFRPTVAATGSAMILFHGGGWRRGEPSSMHPHCERLAAQGMFAASAQYRLWPSQAEHLKDCIADARAAIAWMHEQAANFGYDAQRIAAGGGSAGGHLAACCAIIPDSSWPQSRPCALVLHNPVVDNGPGQFGYKRVGDEYHLYSPLHRIGHACPPTCFLLGTEDEGLPISVGLEFQKRMQDAGNRCDLHLFGGQCHGFSRHGRERFEECTDISHAFLRGLGLLSETKHPY